MSTIRQLLESIQQNNSTTAKLENNRTNWSRLGSRDKFEEFKLSKSDLDDFLKAWVRDNEYSNIK